MPKQLRDFIAVAAARERWFKASLSIVYGSPNGRDEHRVHYRTYSRMRDEYERDHGVFLHFSELP